MLLQEAIGVKAPIELKTLFISRKVCTATSLVRTSGFAFALMLAKVNWTLFENNMMKAEPNRGRKKR